jgi:hypothetical protein
VASLPEAGVFSYDTYLVLEEDEQPPFYFLHKGLWLRVTNVTVETVTWREIFVLGITIALQMTSHTMSGLPRALSPACRYVSAVNGYTSLKNR